MRSVIRAAVLVSAWNVTGCAFQADGLDGELSDANPEAIEFVNVGDLGDLVLIDGVPTPPSPAATLALYSEAGFWGDTMVQNATPGTTVEAVNLIRTTQIQSANLHGRISSFRLICGTRDAYVVLFGAVNNGTSLHDWSEFSKGRAFSCKANQTLSVGLHQQAPELADRVGSIYLVSHAQSAFQFTFFSGLLESKWNATLPQELPDGASADGGVRLKLDGSSSFRLRQFLTVDSAACEERGAIFGLRAIMNQNRTFDVSVVEVYVDTGWGDRWGCREGMEDEVRSGALEAADRLEGALQELSLLAGEHPRYYFVPGSTMRDIELVGGGDRIFPPHRLPDVIPPFTFTQP